MPHHDGAVGNVGWPPPPRHARRLVRVHVDFPDAGLRVGAGGVPDIATNVEITAGPSCRLGSIRQHDPSGLVAAELVFATALTRGELYPVTYETVSPLAEQTGYVAALVRAGIASFSLTIEFDPSVVPMYVYRVWRKTADSPHKRIADLRLMDDRWVHIWLRDPPPGSHGVRWEPCVAGMEP